MLPIIAATLLSFNSPAAVLSRCALNRDEPAADVLTALKEVEINPLGLPASAADIAGKWELVFSTAAAKLPLIDGYMPNKEVLNWDLDNRQLDLEIETFKLLPNIKVVGKELSWDERAQTLTYTVEKKQPSKWTLNFLDRENGVIAARSSVTGLNVIQRLRGGVREIEDMEDWEAAQAEASDKLLVVDFTATWCGPCQRIAPTYAALAEEYAETALLVKVDVDNLGELAAELGVTSMPTFLFFRSGEMIDSMRGADEDGLRMLVAEHAKAPVPA